MYKRKGNYMVRQDYFNEYCDNCKKMYCSGQCDEEKCDGLIGIFCVCGLPVTKEENLQDKCKYFVPQEEVHVRTNNSKV